MKLVRFQNGTFGVRRWFFKYQYLDLKASCVQWWGLESTYFNDCQSDEQTAMAGMVRAKDVGKPV